MNNKIKRIIAVAAALITAVSFSACKKGGAEENAPEYIVNGGFESGDIFGWTVEYGDAFSDDCVVSKDSFSFAGDPNNGKIAFNKTGNWFLYGRAFDDSYSNARTGALRSSTFTLPESGSISVKLAGGALTKGKGEAAAKKDAAKLCYVSVHLEKNGLMIAKQTNDYFVEHTESYVNVSKYEAGVYNTDNFYRYTLDLSEYAGEEMYIRIVDNDDGYYYSYLSVDDIQIGDEGEQAAGEKFTKVREYDSATGFKEGQNQISNGGFESGSLAGWTVISGNAFSNEGVNSNSVWWNENITYNRDGNYHYGYYRPNATGVMRSEEFVLGGSGYISYKLGGCANQDLTYLRVMKKGEAEDTEIARMSNFKYWNFQFPYVANGMKLLNLVQYYADFSGYIGETLYIEAVDNNADGSDLGCMTLDSVVTYWEQKPVWYDKESFEFKLNNHTIEDSEYQLKNGGFETGDLTDWTILGNIGGVSGDSTWLDGYTFNKKGGYLFSGWGGEETATGTLTSSAFKLGGSGFITYMLGGGKNMGLCYLAVYDADTDEEIARFGNTEFRDRAGFGSYDINRNTFLANMVEYKADLSAHIGKNLYLKLVDNATSDWGLFFADQFVTYYSTADAISKDAVTAQDITPVLEGSGSEYQVLNGGFETGDLTGWTLNGDILGISNAKSWWNEWLSYDKDGVYFVDGFSGKETATGTLTSSQFKIGGSGYITYKLGGGRDTSLCYIEIVDALDGTVLAKFGNSMFKDNGLLPYNGQIRDLTSIGSYLANMVLYKADLSAHTGKTVFIRLVDNATTDWGLMFADSFITYYENTDGLPQGAVAAVEI